MRFRLLGPVEASGSSGEVPLGGPKQRSVLAQLALSANRVVPVERLIAGVWGDDANERAGATLQVYVSNLRRLLRTADGDGPATATIDAQRPGYVLRTRLDDVDLFEFTRLVDEGRAAVADDRAAAGAHLLHTALELWRGPALADLVDEPFAGPEVVRLEQAHMAAVEERVEVDLTLGRHHDVVGELEHLVVTHPLRERLWGQLIVALYRSGRQADALGAYGRARTTLAEELGIDPGPGLRELESAILRQEISVDVPNARTPAIAAPVRLPTPAGRTIGREDEAATLRETLSSTRLLTLTGPGGSGKTRLLLTVAAAAADDFAGGTYFVDLTELTDAAQVAPAIVRSLVGSTPTGEPVATAAATLGDREVLLVLDNVEHVLEAAADIAALIRAAPGVRVLASSQISLRVADEFEYRVTGLPTPAPGARIEVIAASGAVQLFVARASRVRRTFTLGPANAEVVAAVCRRLDGLPLAIELAASRLRMLSAEALYERLDDSLSLLSSGPRDAPTRQRTLRATVEWSVGLLDERTRTTLGRLGVFAGDFDLAAATAVCGADHDDALETLLVNSLLRSDEQEEPHFRLSEAVRQYAREVLVPPAGSQRVLADLVDHYVGAAEAAHAEIDGPRAAAAARSVERQQANFRLALESALGTGRIAAAARIAVALTPVWLMLGQVSEARSSTTDVIAAADGAPLDAAVWLAAGRLAYQHNDLEQARAALGVALSDRSGATPLTAGDAALARSLRAAVSTSFGDPAAEAEARAALADAELVGDYAPRAFARSILAIAAARRGDFAREKELYEQRLLLARAHQDGVRIADTLTVLGEIAFDEEDYATATDLVRQAFAEADGRSRPESRDALIMLGRIAVADHDPERAAGFLDEALARAVDIGQPVALASCLRVHAAAATLQGDAARGARLFGAGDALQPALVPVNPNVERDLARWRDSCRDALGGPVFAREYAIGTTLDPAGAVALAARPAEPRVAV